MGEPLVGETHKQENHMRGETRKKEGHRWAGL